MILNDLWRDYALRRSGATLYGGSVETVSLGGKAIGTTVSNSTVSISSGGLVSGSTLYRDRRHQFGGARATAS
jgi:autotransporter passenger strand-loop-strand repeat protein